MRKAQTLVGLNIVSQSDGVALGKARDLIFDHDANELIAIVLAEKELFGFIQSQVVPWREVVSVGPHAIIVQSAASKIKAGDDERISEVAQRQTSLAGTRIMTTDGQMLGTMADVFIDEGSGHVVGYEVSGGFMSDTLRGKRFMPAVDSVQIGKDVAFVPPEAAKQMEPRSFQDGSWHQTTIAANERFQNLVGGARERAEQLYSQVSHASAERQQEWVTGRVAGREVKLPANEVVAGQSDVLAHIGEVITPEMALRARETGILGALTLSAIEATAASTYTTTKDRLSGPREGAGPIQNVQAKASAAAIGQAAGRTVSRADGSVLIAQGEIITDEVMAEARVLEQENELIAAAGLGAAQRGVETAREQATDLFATMKERVEEWGGSTQIKREEQEQLALQKRIDAAAGLHAARTVLDRNDSPIVVEGEIITHSAIERAREAGLLDVLLDAATIIPPSPVVVETVTMPQP